MNNVSDIYIKIQQFVFKNMHLNYHMENGVYLM